MSTSPNGVVHLNAVLSDNRAQCKAHRKGSVSMNPPAMSASEGPRIVRPRSIYRAFSRIIRTGKPARASNRTIGVSGVILGFVLLIAVGTVLLSLPVSRAPGQEWNLVTALFTATSSVCVTGLVVVDTSAHWSRFGQGVILGLIQVGGLGIMTASMLILILLGRSISIRDQFEVYETSRLRQVRTVPSLVLLTVIATGLIETFGMLAISFRLGAWSGADGALWKAGFLAVSAFNNAGFDIMGDSVSLTGFTRDPVLLAIVAGQVVLGSVGVLVLFDLVTKRAWKGLSINSKVVLLTSALLLTLGFIGILAGESGNPETLGLLTIPDKLSNAFFHSVTARTAGFHTIAVGGFEDETLFLTTVLMYIGGAVGSTAGGIKVTTAALLFMAMMGGARGYDHTSGFGRRFPHRLVYRALAIASLSLGVVFIGTYVLTTTEQFQFRQVLFEVVSAFGTVGLSTGITPELSTTGKLTISVIMFIGRLGPLTVAFALAQRAREPRYELPDGQIPIG